MYQKYNDMKIKHLLFVAAVLSGLCGKAQVFQPDVISSSGAVTQRNNIILQWHLGELAIHTLKSHDHHITQGFGQGELVITRIEPLQRQPLQANVFPNPVKNVLHIDLELSDNQYTIQLFDMRGVLLQEGQSYGLQVSLDMSYLDPGIYFLKIQKTWLQTASFKIVKN